MSQRKQALSFRIFNSLFFSLLFVFFFLAPDFLAAFFNTRLHTVVPPSTVLLLLLAGLSIHFLPRRHAWAALLFLFLLQVTALGYLCYFGRSLTAREIPFIFHQWDEVVWMGWGTFLDYWYVLAACGTALAGNLWAASSGKAPAKTRWAWLGLAAVVLLPAHPFRSASTELSVSVASPYWPSIRSGTTAFAWLLARGVVPGPPGPAYAPYRVQRRSGSAARNLVLAVADSCSTRYMSLYGYGRPTTPLLERYRGTPGFLFRPGLSGSTASLASMRVLLNLVREPGNGEALWSRRTNLVRLAREAGYRTIFLSAQRAKNTALAGPEFAELAFHEDGPAGSPTAEGRDDALLAALQKVPLGEKNFIVLHQRNLHNPYAWNTETHPECRLFPEANSFGSYLNAMVCYDRWVDALFRWCREHLEGESYVFLTSDHGETFGEQGINGHLTLDPLVADVPAMVYGIRPDSDFFSQVEAFRVLTHHDLGLLMADRLGYEIHNPNAVEGSYVIQDINLEHGTRFIPVRIDTKGGHLPSGSRPGRGQSGTGKPVKRAG